MRYALLKAGFWILAVLFAGSASAKGLSRARQAELSELLTRILDREVRGNKTRITGAVESNGRLTLYASAGMSYYPFREENVAAIYDSIRALLPESFARHRLTLITDRHAIEDLVPLVYRSDAGHSARQRFVNPSDKPLVTRPSAAAQPEEGLTGRHIALWQSHGRYFDQAENRWKWQRGKLWQTCEDLYTQGYVLPYLVPMLENAGANVLLPRERDLQQHEIIADNDPGIDSLSSYDEYTGSRKWYPAGTGFAHLSTVYEECRNPFSEGTVRGIQTVTEAMKESRAVWNVAIPQTDDYAVYVSYRTVEGSSDDARYTVRHLGGESEFRVNQTMGGGTWIYLGTFRFAAGANPAAVTLSNRSEHKNRIVTADAVRIGGGMGNIARIPSDKFRTEDLDYTAETSGYPRFCEGSRYWLQWAGFSEDVYRGKEGMDDYKEDYMSRAHWVNALMGGSERLPDEKGLGIPIDMALAFHSDAGTRRDDEIIGTLGIFCTQDHGGTFHGGADRYRSRDLTDVVMTQIVDDIRATFEPEWRRRGMWNRSYYEARVPNVPTMLLELLSHQNFADMRYGHDPRFRFLVSRAVYKGILKHLACQYERPYTVQPLPVDTFSAVLTEEEGTVRLSWHGVADSLEPTARPTGYVLYTRRGNGDFDNGIALSDTTFVRRIEPGEIYSFRVTATNAGGESFPSETLSAGWRPDSKGRVLVVNGFDRVSAPLSVQGDSLAGFHNELDSGVPYIREISFVGQQRVFLRSRTESENYDDCLGSCYSDYEGRIVGGNTFDYPRLHGTSILEAGYSFCSASARSLESESVEPTDFFFLDLILGKQRSVTMGRGTGGWAFKTFPPQLQTVLARYVRSGRSILVSGSFVATDLWRSPAATESDRTFARNILHYGYRGDLATRCGRVRTIASPARLARDEYRFNMTPCRECYAVEAPDALAPAEGGFVAMRYCENDQAAAIGYAGNNRSLVLGFPFETIGERTQRDRLMAEILRFLEPRK